MSRFARALRNLRREGPSSYLRRHLGYIVNPFLRRRYYPWLAERAVRRLGRANRRRRARALASGGAAGPRGRVYVMICVDTEGPNSEAPYTTWADVDAEVDRVLDPRFRHEQADPEGRPFALNWFVVDWVGVGRRRGLETGYHAILDRYLPTVQVARGRGFADEIFWHYHHIPPGGTGGYNRDWRVFPQYEEILSRRILERRSWPAVYRAGNTWEDNHCSRWLERFIPFDLSSRGPHRNVHYDWSRAPRDWVLYHPDPEDVQRPGGQRRLMGRSLDIEKGGFRPEEVERAFLRAWEGHDTYVSFYFHDFRPMHRCIADGVAMIREVADRYPGVAWIHADALTALRTLSGHLPDGPLRLEGSRSGLDVMVSASQPVHGEPWLAARIGGACLRCDLSPTGGGSWRSRLPSDADVEALAVAASDPAGQTCILELA